MNIIIRDTLSEGQRQDVNVLQRQVFTNVSEEEIEEDFYNPESAHVLAYEDDKLVGWA